MNDKATKEKVSELNLKLLKRAPFLATIALHAEVLIQEHPQISVAATDGRRIYLSPSGFTTRPVPEKLFIYAHEVLHCALSHPLRRGTREPRLWNIAADIVVNGMLILSGLTAPADIARDEGLEHLSTEEVYEQLLAKATTVTVELGSGEGGGSGLGEDLLEPNTDVSGKSAEDLRGHWQGVLRRAATLARMTSAGTLPLGVELALALGKQQVDWREVLMRYLVSTSDDYGAFDTRLIYAGIYVETLESQSLTAAVHIDTSGSLNDAESQGQFLAELKGILNAYPGVQVILTYGDTELYGPFDLTQDTTVPPPKGGGGTSFIPFFESVQDLELSTPLVVFTDGYGSFPASCDHPCLWVVAEGGLPTNAFPFGEVTRLAS